MMLQILIFAGSIVVGILAFLMQVTGFFAFSLLAQSLITGALKIYIYEFITEIIFPVSPCFGLAIIHALSGLLSLLI
jgi:ABC-type bacteriocin/lantibiotic exporter with double-glycine peptidase domain